MSSNEVATRQHQGSALVIDPDQNYFTDAQIRVLTHLGVKDAAPADLAVFFHHSQRTGLDPFAKQIYMIGRKDKTAPGGIKQTIQTGIDGFRLIARRAADRAGDTLGYGEPEWCGEDGSWRGVWLPSEPPAAARVTVFRAGQPFPAVAHWSEFVQTNYEGSPTVMWKRMGRNQLRKCAEAQALRMAFPQDLSGLYTDDEMAHTEHGAAARPRKPATQRSALNDAMNADEPVDAEVVDPDADAAQEFMEQTP